MNNKRLLPELFAIVPIFASRLGLYLICLLFLGVGIYV